jgi:ABC-2 type transport system permease protein
MLLRPYLSVFAARFQLMLQYRTAAVAGFATQCWWGAIKVMVFAAFFAGSTMAQPLSLRQTVDYIWLGQAFLIFLPWNGDADVAEMVRSGAVAYERLRPVDTYAWWFARAIATGLARVAPRAALMFAMAGLILPLLGFSKWSLHPPASLEAGLLFALSMVGVAVLSAAMNVIITITTVATLSDRGANTLMAPISGILSGSIIPLAFYPAWLHPLIELQPFAGLVDTPFRIYFGGLGGADAVAGIAMQFGWTAALILVGHAWLGRAMTRLQVQGG